ncbi:MAG TPA: NADH-quinone oxidoreductase subunit J [Actinomycetota bacterium]|nr:NADH-quinone oxidoreductase subunit J [Actinomycetota bacterium]
MKTSLIVDVLFWMFAAGSIVAGWLVFRTDSMVRAAYWLLASFVGVGAILVLLAAEFLGLVLILMMAGEMTIMAVFMVMFMMNPAGLNPMQMVHQHRVSITGGVIAFVALAAAGIFASFPDRPASTTGDTTAELGIELLGDSMLVFQTAGVALLTTMIGAIVLASRSGRFGDAQEGSSPPELHLEGVLQQAERHTPAAPAPEEEEHHH